MKIEKISDIQIKCTLNQQDLKDRELRLSELAYGSEKARALFSELLLQASYECGFEAQDVPLMIEAVPMSKDSLVLILTKVADPEELNVTYSNISIPQKKKSASKVALTPKGARADELFGEVEKAKIFDNIPAADPNDKDAPMELRLLNGLNASIVRELNKYFVFKDLSELIKLAGLVAPFYNGINTIYKDPKKETYYLVLNLGYTDIGTFNKVCNICAEYGEALHTPDYSKAYFDEHYKIIINNKAIERLKLLNKH